MAEKKRKPPKFHPYAFDVLIGAIGRRSAQKNLAFVLECARTDEPATKEMVDRFIKEAPECLRELRW